MRDLAADVRELLRRVDTEPDLERVMDAFFDLVQAHPSLMTQGEAIDATGLPAVLREVIGPLAAEIVVPEGRSTPDVFPVLFVQWRRHRTYGLVHGSLVVEGHIGVAFFLERRGLGALILTAPGKGAHFGRLRVLPRPPADPSRN
jgi:hypothetical protein